MSDFNFYFGLGWEHIMSWDALDHLLFIAALAAIYLLKDWKQVLILVTAFTLGHSLTLALSVMDVFRFPSNWVEFLIACTIVVTAISNLFQKKFTPKSIRINYFLALFFGLIHGMGFANTIRFMLANDQSFGWSVRKLPRFLVRPLVDETKRKLQCVIQRCLDRVALLFREIKHQVHVVTHVPCGQAVQSHASHVPQHIVIELGKTVRSTRNFLNHQALVIVVHLLKIESHIQTSSARLHANCSQP